MLNDLQKNRNKLFRIVAIFQQFVRAEIKEIYSAEFEFQAEKTIVHDKLSCPHKSAFWIVKIRFFGSKSMSNLTKGLFSLKGQFFEVLSNRFPKKFKFIRLQVLKNL